jgi:hypothetical protein
MVGSAIMIGRRVTAIVRPSSANSSGDAPTAWENAALRRPQVPSAPISAPSKVQYTFEFQIKHSGEAAARRDAKGCTTGLSPPQPDAGRNWYLANGKPAVMQRTGPSRMLPDGAGLFRFEDLCFLPRKCGC